MAKHPAAVHPGYAQGYIDQVQEDTLELAFNQQEKAIQALQKITEEQSLYAYAPGKWTIREMIQHIIDAERIFSYRSLCIARGETQTLPGFEEDDYAAASEGNHRNWNSLLQEWQAVRLSTRLLFSSFNEQMLTRVGSSNNTPLTPIAIGFILIGHATHHLTVLQQRYHVQL